MMFHHWHVLRCGAARQQQAQQECSDDAQQVPAYQGQPTRRLWLTIVAVIDWFKVIAIVISERASGVVYLTIVYAVGVVAVMVATFPAIVNSSFHILSVFRYLLPAAVELFDDRSDSRQAAFYPLDFVLLLLQTLLHDVDRTEQFAQIVTADFIDKYRLLFL